MTQSVEVCVVGNYDLAESSNEVLNVLTTLTTSNIEKSNREIRESVNMAIREIESSGDGFKDARRILETVQNRGGGED
jgi:hypothetical protein